MDSVSDSEDFDFFSMDYEDDFDRDFFCISIFTFRKPPSCSADVMPLENWRGFMTGRFLSEPSRFSYPFGELDFCFSAALWLLC